MTASLGEPVQLQVLYWGAALLAGLGAAAWKAAGMRGDINEKWATRVDVLQSGLSEGAIRELTGLRTRIEELLGRDNFDPLSAIVDPAVLLQSVRKFEKILRIRRRVERHFEWLLRLGNILVVSLLSMILGVIVLALVFSNVLELSHQLTFGIVCLAIGVVSCVGCFIMYWTLQNKLSGAEILAQSVSD